MRRCCTESRGTPQPTHFAAGLLRACAAAIVLVGSAPVIALDYDAALAQSQAAVGRSACVVHLNPADHARLEGVRFRSGTRIEPDVGVPQGDVHVETPIGLLVRDTESALESIERRLHEELG